MPDQAGALEVASLKSESILHCILGVYGSSETHEAVQHSLTSGMLEVDLELAVFDRGDGAEAEFGVEDARSGLPRLTALALG